MVGDGVELLSSEVNRVADRLRTSGHARLARPLREADRLAAGSPEPGESPWPGGGSGSPQPAGSPTPGAGLGDVGVSVADAAHTVAQQLADLAADAEGRHRVSVPRLGDHAVGDQVAVTGNDLVALARAGLLDPARLDRAVELLRDLRLALP